MNKKIVVVALAAVTLVGVRLAEAQQVKKVARIGFLDSGGAPAAPSSEFKAFQQGLRDLGYTEGRNVYIEKRYAEGNLDTSAALVSELVEQKVDVLVANNNVAIRAAKKLTKTIPIVMRTAIDPVMAGYVDSFAHPGGNITGIAAMTRELSGKRLELFRETIPKMRRLGALLDGDGPASKVGLKGYQSIAPKFRLDLQSLEVHSPSPDFERAFQTVKNGRMDALIVISSPLIRFHQKRIMDLAIKDRLPSMTEGSDVGNGGALISYGRDFYADHRRLAYFVDKIIRGTNPADLPVEQPTKLELIVNLKTAKQIGLTIPQSVLYRADKVIR